MIEKILNFIILTFLGCRLILKLTAEIHKVNFLLIKSTLQTDGLIDKLTSFATKSIRRENFEKRRQNEK